jgi:hypothetical protein
VEWEFEKAEPTLFLIREMKIDVLVFPLERPHQAANSKRLAIKSTGCTEEAEN